MNYHGIEIPKLIITEFCRWHYIRWLALFGSILREDFGPESDVDFLAEFEPDQIPNLLGIAGMEMELSELIGRKADLRTTENLSRYFREEVISSAVILSVQK